MDILIAVVVIMSVFIGLRFLMQKRAQRSKGKEVDITNYLKKAEGFDKKIQLINKEGVI